MEAIRIEYRANDFPRRGKTLLFLSVLLIVSNAPGCFGPDDDSNTRYPITHSISNIQSEGPIFLDAVIDANNAIHLVWQSEEQGINYQYSDDYCETWSSTNQLSKPSALSRSIGPRIINNGDSLTVIWLSKEINLSHSDDRGASWTNRSYDFGTQARDFDIDAKDNIVALAYFSGTHIYCSLSEDFGSYWSEPLCLTAEIENGSGVSAPAIAILGNTVHIVWSHYTEIARGNYSEANSSLLYMKSEDLGRSWYPARQIQNQSHNQDNGDDMLYPILHPDICAAGEVIHVVYQTSVVEHLSSTNQGNTWNRMQPITQTPVRALELETLSPSEVHVLWVDERFQKREWWSHIPGYQAILWDADPMWANNDLFYSALSMNQIINDLRLTRPLSFVEPRRGSFAGLMAGDSIVVFWSGKERVGKSIGESSGPGKVYSVKAAAQNKKPK